MKINNHHPWDWRRIVWQTFPMLRRTVGKCVPRKMASQRRNSDLQSPPRQLQISHALPQFPPLISRTLRLLCRTVMAHFTRIARTRRHASQRTARAPSLSSDPETVLTVETASHLATSEPQILVPRLSKTDLPGITHPLLHISIVPLSIRSYP